MKRIIRITNIVSLIAGVAIVVSLSMDILTVGSYTLDAGYLEVQLAACIIFLFDFFVRLADAPNKGRFWAANWFMLMVCIPYLNIVGWLGIEPGKDWYIVLKSLPIIRAIWAIWMIIGWVAGYKSSGLLWSYLLTVCGFTYFAGLIFYAYEMGVNPHLSSFGDSLWWAWMGVTTVGAAIFPVTTTGKILAVALPSLGMMMFPVFTVYLISSLKKKNEGK